MSLTLQLWQKIKSRFDLEENVSWIDDVIRRGDEIDIFVFPESALWGPIENKHTYPSQEQFEAAILKLQKTCKEFGKNIIFGTPYPTDNGVENRAYFLGGRNPQYYTKIHVHWTEEYKSGNKFPIFKWNGIDIGILICFDIAFPEAARILTLKGIQILFIIAATPDTFHPRYNKNRAKGLSILNQIWTVYLNRSDAGCNGNSIVVNPRGDSIIEFNSEIQKQTVNIDINEVYKWRKEEPALKFRKPELYKKIIDTKKD